MVDILLLMGGIYEDRVYGHTELVLAISSHKGEGMAVVLFHT